ARRGSRLGRRLHRGGARGASVAERGAGARGGGGAPACQWGLPDLSRTHPPGARRERYAGGHRDRAGTAGPAAEGARCGAPTCRRRHRPGRRDGPALTRTYDPITSGYSSTMASLAPHDVSELGGRLSILWRQKQDHARLDRLLDDLAAAPGPVERAQTLGRIARLVFPHAFAEESVLWPVVHRLVPGGEALTSEVEQEHQEVNELWRRLETAHHPDDLDDEHQSILGRLAEVLREDVRDEEDRILPRLHDTLTPARLRVLGVVWDVVRNVAPARPHPIVS